jgi:threonine dehydrogenase-like Zn-dependent dehydrogenase
MKALLYERELRYVTDYPVPRPGKGEALVRIRYAGICSTDREIVRGYMDFRGIPGHEFVGTVVRCRGKASLVGKRVVGEINLGCGRCRLCRQGNQNHCPSRSVLGILNRDGVFAEYCVLPVRNLHVLPDSIADREAVFTEPLAAALEILDQVAVTPEHRVCVLGDGKLGLLAAQVLAEAGCRLTASGRHKEKLAILRKRGITTRQQNTLRGKDFDIVVDCTGSSEGILQALALVRPGGTVVLKSTVADPECLDSNYMIINEISIIGSRCGPFARAVEALQSKKVAVLPLISREFPLEEGVEAFRYALKKGVLKVLLKVDWDPIPLTPPAP